ncbi:MAG: glycosylase, partial [Lachnospiraceae bacterium]|nr:glycosylase [Lachnospiraceae bacterium]
LQSDAAFGVLYAEEKKNPFVYRRGSMIIALNPSGQEVSAPVPASGRKKVYEIGQGRADHEGIRLCPQSCLILK